MASGRKHLVTFFTGLFVVGGIAYVGAQELTAPPSVALAQDTQDPPAGEQAAGDEARRDHPRPRLHRAIRGELVVPGETEGTFQNVRLDRGVVERVDGATIVIKEDDGTTVEVPTTDETRVRRDGEEASVGDLRAGDHVATVRVEGATKLVRAFSPERWQEMQERREQCRENPRECRRERPGGREAPAA
jgi:hypothetical protein